jgi:bifunctional DNase/RNase
MIEVTVHSVYGVPDSNHWTVLLKEKGGLRYLPILIGYSEANALVVELHKAEPRRPLTHDLLKTAIESLGAAVSRIQIKDLKGKVFHTHIVVKMDGCPIELDARPSDAIALAVRADAPIFVAEGVMDRAGVLSRSKRGATSAKLTPEEREELNCFRGFLDTLDLDNRPTSLEPRQGV